MIQPEQATQLDRDNADAMSYLLELANSNKAWKACSSPSDSKIYKRYADYAPGYLSESDKLACRRHEIVRGEGIIDATPQDVFDVFRDNDSIMKLNNNCENLIDLHLFPSTTDFQGRIQWTKVAFSKATPKHLPFVKSREFYSLVTFNQFLNNGTYIIVNRPAYMSAESKITDSVLGSILLAGNIIEPFHNRTRITQIIHINPGGSADTPAVAWILNKKQLPSYVTIQSIEAVVKESRGNIFAPRGRSVRLSRAFEAFRYAFIRSDWIKLY
jgi:hypothetical protein